MPYRPSLTAGPSGPEFSDAPMMEACPGCGVTFDALEHETCADCRMAGEGFEVAYMATPAPVVYRATDAHGVPVPGEIACYLRAGDGVLCPVYTERVRLHGDAYVRTYFAHHPKGSLPISQARLDEMEAAGRVLATWEVAPSSAPLAA